MPHRETCQHTLTQDSKFTSASEFSRSSLPISQAPYSILTVAVARCSLDLSMRRVGMAFPASLCGGFRVSKRPVQLAALSLGGGFNRVRAPLPR